jgi:hypothetical protein
LRALASAFVERQQGDLCRRQLGGADLAFGEHGRPRHGAAMALAQPE